MEQFAKPGDFCPNQACPDYQKLQANQSEPNIIKAGKTRKGVQRLKCCICGKYFVETTGTIFYRKRTLQHEILETLALLAEGNRISSLTRVKGHKEDLKEIEKLKEPGRYFANMFNAYTRGVNNATGRSGALFERPFERIPVTDSVILCA